MDYEFGGTGVESRTSNQSRMARRTAKLPRSSESGGASNGLLLLVAVGALVSLGLMFAGRVSNEAPTCGGEVMSRGDSCVDYSGSGGGGTYEEVKEGVPGQQRANFIASAVCFSLAGLAVVGGLRSWRKGRRQNAERSAVLGGRSMAEAATALAAVDDLGGLLDSTQDDDSEEHHRFERGLVADTERGPVSFPYRDVRIYRGHCPDSSSQGDLVTAWRFERSDGQVWKTIQRNNAPLGPVLEQVLASACAQQQAAAVQQLAQGATLVFGPVEINHAQITATGIGTGKSRRPGTWEWSAVEKLSIGKGPVMEVEGARGISRNVFCTVPLGDIPNFPLCWKVANLAHSMATGPPSAPG